MFWNVVGKVSSPSVCGDLNAQKPKLTLKVFKLLCEEGINLIILELC